MLYVIFIIPLVQLLTGYLMYKYPPKKINRIIGYRTFRSMKNKEMWDWANRYCGKVWLNISIILFLITALLFVLFYLNVITFTENILLIIVFGQLTIMLLSVLIIENKLKNNNIEKKEK